MNLLMALDKQGTKDATGDKKNLDPRMKNLPCANIHDKDEFDTYFIGRHPLCHGNYSSTMARSDYPTSTERDDTSNLSYYRQDRVTAERRHEQFEGWERK